MDTSTHIRAVAREAIGILKSNSRARPNYPAIEYLHRLANELNIFHPRVAEPLDVLVELAEIYYADASHHPLPIVEQERLHNQMLTQAQKLLKIADELSPDG